ncbi:MAG: LysM peptidoglycan-binding domain-containing protein [Oscillospiraceae bacterium]
MFIYTVQSGDNLNLLSRRFGLPANRIAADNALRYPNNLVVGQSLVIMSNSMRYTLKEGQTMYSIAQEFGVPLEILLEANPNVNPISLQAGDVITIPMESDVSRRPAVINGYAYPNITEFALNCALPFLTFLSPFSYSITSLGELIAPAADDLIYRATRSAVMPLMVVTNIYDGSFSTEVLSQILADSEARERLISSIFYELDAKGYYGLNLDMEYISPDDRESYNAFLMELSGRLHEAGYILVTAVAPKYRADQQGILYESHDYRVQGEAADYVIIMTYEWGYTYSAPMSVQPIEEVRKVLTYAVSEIPSEKILMGMPNYGYDWTLPYTRGTAAQSIGFIAATDLAVQHNSEIHFDEISQTPYFNYTENGTRHVVWFDDPRSIDAKLRLVEEFDLAGASWWTINRCFVPNWLIVQNQFEVVKL